MKRITLTEAQMQALAGLLDAGVRATGLRSVKDAAGLLDAMEKAEDAPEDDAGANA